MLVPNEGKQLPWAAPALQKIFGSSCSEVSCDFDPKKDYMTECFSVAPCASPSRLPTTLRGASSYLAFPSSSMEKTCLPARQ